MQAAVEQSVTVAREGKPSGRRSKSLYTPKVRKRLLAAIADGLTISQAVIVAGIGQTTYYDWKEAHPELEPLLQKARETARQKALETIKRAAPDDWRAAESFLKLSFHNDYNNKNTINVNANAQAGVAIEVSDPERAALIEKRERALTTSASAEVLPVGERARELALPAPSDSVEAETLKETANAEGRDIHRA